MLSAKIVAKSRARPQNRFGYVSMAAADQADRCIKELNGTELKGRKITVEVVWRDNCSKVTISERWVFVWMATQQVFNLPYT